MADLDVVVVGYYSGEDCERLMEDLPRACALKHRLHFFDNSGNPKTLTRCWNELAYQGKAPFIAFLNTDIRLSPGWDAPLAEHLKSSPTTGSALPAPVGHGWPTLVKKGSQPFPDPKTAPAPSYENMAKIAECFKKDEGLVSFGGECNAAFYAVMTERGYFEKLKGFDERFRLYCQDHDYQRRMFARFGKYSVRVSRSRVWHRDGGCRMEASRRGALNFQAELRHFGTIKSALKDGRLKDWDKLSDEERRAIRKDETYARMPR